MLVEEPTRILDELLVGSWKLQDCKQLISFPIPWANDQVVMLQKLMQTWHFELSSMI